MGQRPVSFIPKKGNYKKRRTKEPNILHELQYNRDIDIIKYMKMDVRFLHTLLAITATASLCHF